MNQMGQKIVAMIVLGTLALVIGLGALRQAQAHQAKQPYPSMAPVDQYLMERNAEIAMARSAAPEAISRDADVLVLGRHGYETAVKGKNGFVCVVERGWMGPFVGKFAVNFWNPNLRGPVCSSAPHADSGSGEVLVDVQRSSGPEQRSDTSGNGDRGSCYRRWGHDVRSAYTHRDARRVRRYDTGEWPAVL